MKTPEDEAFEELERRQGGGFKAKQAMAADKLQKPVCAIEKPKLMLEKFLEMKDLLDDTTPPQRKWVGLTQKEVQEIHDTYHKRMGPQEFASMLEAKLKEKNT